MTDPDKIETPDRRRKGGLLVLVVFALLCGAVALGAFALVGRPLDAPPWLRERIETRIAETVPGIDVDFGRMSLQVERSGIARVILWDVTIRNASGGQVAALSDLEAGFSPGALLRGKLVLREAQLSGAFLTLTRAPDGTLGLALGDAFAAGTKAPSLPEMIAMVDAAFLDPRLAELDKVEADALTIRYEDQRARRGWTVDGGRLRILRQSGVLDLSGDLALLAGGDRIAAIEVNASSPIGQTALDFGIALRDLAARDIATQSPALAWLEALDAPISGALRSALRPDGSLGPLNATLQIGSGVLQPNAATRPVPFDGARTYFTYSPEKAQLVFDEISVTSPLGEVIASGKAQLDGLEAGWPTALLGQVRLSRILVAKDALLERSVELSGADMDFKLVLAPFQISLGRLRISDPALPVRLSGDLVARRDGWQVALDATLARTSPEQVLSYWPMDFRPGTRAWVADHVRGGRIEDITFALRVEPDTKPMTYIDFAFQEGDVLYNQRLPGVTGGAGRLTLYDKRLGVRIDKGQIDAGQGGAIDVSGSAFVIPDLTVKPAIGVLDLRARGSITAALAYVDNDAWQVLRKLDRDAGLATGQAEITGSVSLPLTKGLALPDITLDLAGTLRDVRSDTLVKGRPLRADRLALALSNSQISIAGPVTLSGVAADGRWTQPLDGGQGKVTAAVRIDPATLDAFNIGLPDGMLSGRGTGQFALDLTKGAAPRFSLVSDLAGIGLTIPQLGWTLPTGTTGRFEVTGALGTSLSIDSLALRGAGMDAAGTLSLRAGGGLEELRLDKLSLGNWLDVVASLRGRGAGVAPAIEIRGGSVDLRQAGFGAGGGGGGGGGGSPLSITLDRLQVTDSIVLNRFAGAFDGAAGLQGKFTARLGPAPISGRVVPQNGRSAFRITGEDAGDILKAAGLLKTVQNGSFQLDLAPVRGTTGSYDGEMTIKETRLRQAPAIAALLDAISIVGLLDQLNGPGIFFSEVEARFRLTPNRVILTRSSAVGPSMGISMDGFYDIASGQMDMQGVLSPIYILNGIGRIISRKGEGLIGFNFNLRGPVARPQVLVNPLSVFTPGMFRDIFRRPPPKVSQ